MKQLSVSAGARTTDHSSDLAKRLCFSVRLLVPFLRVLRGNPRVPMDVIAPLEALDPDERLPIADVHELLRGAIALTGDPDLGLKAGREVRRGDYGALEYVGRSAETWGESLELVGRFMRLVNDALTFKLDFEGGRAFLQLESLVELPRAAADFQSAGFMRTARSLCRESEPKLIDVWFLHSRPDCIDEYERTFAPCNMRFDAPFNGFVIDRELLAPPIAEFDPVLHSMIREHAGSLVAELPKAESTTEKVRELIAKQLQNGARPSFAAIARQMHMSQSTLARRLEREATSFQNLLDDLRRRLAQRYIGTTDLAFSEIAFLLGFTQSPAFHRAFKRWTSQTPLEYRRSTRRQSPAH